MLVLAEKASQYKRFINLLASISKPIAKIFGVLCNVEATAGFFRKKKRSKIVNVLKGNQNIQTFRYWRKLKIKGLSYK